MFGLFGNNEDVQKKVEIRKTSEPVGLQTSSPKPTTIDPPFFGSATKPSSPAPTNGVSTWRDATSPPPWHQL